MKSSIGYYTQLYRAYIATNFAEVTSYRLHFVLVIIMEFIFYASFLASIGLIYNHVDEIGGWNQSQFLFFGAFVLAIDHLHMTFVSESFWNLSQEIRTGKLDFTLVRPANSIFSVFCRFIRPSTLMNIPVVWGLLIYFGIEVGLSPVQWILIFPMVLLGFLVMAHIEFVLACSMFWLVEGAGINFLRMQFQEVARWPDFAYLFYARRFFTIAIPLLLIGSAPVHFLFEPRNNWPYLTGACVALVVLSFTFRRLWRVALKSYNSASS